MMPSSCHGRLQAETSNELLVGNIDLYIFIYFYQTSMRCKRCRCTDKLANFFSFFTLLQIQECSVEVNVPLLLLACTQQFFLHLKFFISF